MKKNIVNNLDIIENKIDNSSYKYSVVDKDLEDNILTIVTVNCIISVKDFKDTIYVWVAYDKNEYNDEKEIEKEFKTVKDSYKFIEEYLY